MLQEGINILLIFTLGMLLCGALAYLILCVDPNNQGILGKLHRLLYKAIPNKVKTADGKDSIFYRVLDKVFSYLCLTNHRIIQGFYILVAGGGFILYYFVGLHQHFPNSEVSWHHKWTGSLCAYFAFFTYYCACRQEPG